MRKLGIPTVLDRFIQQAVMQVLQKQWNPTFSPYSYSLVLSYRIDCGTPPKKSNAAKWPSQKASAVSAG